MTTPIAAYAFNEGAGSVAAEASGGPAITDVPGWEDGAMRINGVAGPTLDPFSVTGPFTIMFDAYVVGNGGNGVNILLNNPAIGNVQVANFDGALQWYLGPNPTTGVLLPGSWKNIAITGDNAARKAYLNGAPVGTSGGGLSGSDPLVLGGFAGYFPDVRLKNLRVFDSVIPESEIAELAGTPVAPGEEPPPENIPPTANAGVNRTVYTGQQVTLAGSGTDSDGTIASYAWSQTSGPAVVLAGAGADRTFTPTVAGSYVFSLTTTDDDGDVSLPDSVTITVLTAPVEVDGSGTATPVAKIGSIERAIMALFVRDLEVLEGSDARVGGDFPRVVDDFYIRIDRGPGGRTNTFEGDYNVDIEVFSADYLRAEDISEDIEVLMLASGYHTVVSGGKKWVFDGVFQNIGITDIPWEGDDDTHRLVATYALTVRRGRV